MEEIYCHTVSQTVQKAYLAIVCKQKAQTLQQTRKWYYKNKEMLDTDTLNIS